MKSLILAALLFSGPVAAEEKITPQQYCAQVGELAEVIMQARQMELPLSQMLADLPPGEPGEFIKMVVLDAFDQPAYSTQTNQQEAVASFRNHWEHQCFTAN